MFFTYRGAMFWRMRSGMGDAVFAPLYKVMTAHASGPAPTAGARSRRSTSTSCTSSKTCIVFDRQRRRFVTELTFTTPRAANDRWPSSIPATSAGSPRAAGPRLRAAAARPRDEVETSRDRAERQDEHFDVVIFAIGLRRLRLAARAAGKARASPCHPPEPGRGARAPSPDRRAPRRRRSG